MSYYILLVSFMRYLTDLVYFVFIMCVYIYIYIYIRVLQSGSFLEQFITPLLVATVQGHRTHTFYTTRDFELWSTTHPELAQKARVKYYKGVKTW